MDNDLNNVKVPIIEPHVDQKMIVNFTKNEKNDDVITISFDPDIPAVRTPPQAAAVNVANHIIRSFALNKEEPQPSDTQEAQNGEETSSR